MLEAIQIDLLTGIGLVVGWSFHRDMHATLNPSSFKLSVERVVFIIKLLKQHGTVCRFSMKSQRNILLSYSIVAY